MKEFTEFEALTVAINSLKVTTEVLPQMIKDETDPSHRASYIRQLDEARKSIPILEMLRGGADGNFYS